MPVAEVADNHLDCHIRSEPVAVQAEAGAVAPVDNRLAVEPAAAEPGVAAEVVKRNGAVV